MKAFIKLFILALVLVTSVSYADTKPKKACIIVLSEKYEAFRFKAAKEFLGATIEVYNSSNTLTGKEIVYDQKMIIDFYYMPAGTYRIKIMKGNELIEFEFVKK